MSIPQQRCPTCGVMFIQGFPAAGAGRCSTRCYHEYREEQAMKNQLLEAAKATAKQGPAAAARKHVEESGGAVEAGKGILSKIIASIVLLALLYWGISSLISYVYRAYKNWDDTELVESVKAIDKEGKPFTSWEIGRKIVLSNQAMTAVVSLKVPWYEGRVKDVRCVFISDLQQPIEVNSWGWNTTARLVNYEHINGELVIILNKCDFDKADLLPAKPTTTPTDVPRELERPTK